VFYFTDKICKLEIQSGVTWYGEHDLSNSNYVFYTITPLMPFKYKTWHFRNEWNILKSLMLAEC